MSEEVKPCRSCGQSDRLPSGRCGPCARARASAYRAANPDKVRQRAARYYAENTEKHKAGVRRSTLSRKYGIDEQVYEELLAHQGGVCPICGREPREGERFAVDHDHVAGWLRGVVCSFDNRTTIGQHRRGHMEKLYRVIAYLEAPPGLQLYPGRRVSERRPNGRKWADS